MSYAEIRRDSSMPAISKSLWIMEQGVGFRSTVGRSLGEHRSNGATRKAWYEERSRYLNAVAQANVTSKRQHVRIRR